MLLVVGAGLLWGSSRMTWEWSSEVSDLRGTVVHATDGAGVETGLVPLALLYLAAIAAAVATGGWARRVLGGLVVLAGAAALWLGLHTIAGVFGPQQAGFPLGTVITAHVLVVLAGAGACLAGVVVVRNAVRMPRMGTRYQAPAAARKNRKAAKDPDTALWDELSEGSDPTEHERNRPRAEPTDG